ncbi:MAG: MFS transporter [Lachnospiraceae bacterium]|jgi:GPH family glycoside/pentoside/hexuronide:cation symporter
MFFKKSKQEAGDQGVVYRKAKIWQIICYACQALPNMGVYILIGYASYAANIGFGISTAIVGVLLMIMRIFDAITDPLLAFVYDKVNTRFGKLRILTVLGFCIEALALYLMYDGLASKGFGMPVFLILYMVYVIGYTMINMTIQTFPAIMSNDPHQRPTIGVWATGFNYLVPIGLTVFLNYGLLQQVGGTYNQAFLSSAVKFIILIGAVGTLLCCIGISAYDKPETFRGTSVKREKLKFADMISLIRNNKPFQSYVWAQASDKLAQQVGSQTIITTLLMGIVIGNMGLSTIISAISMLPSILFAIVGARYAGRHGSKNGIVTWTKACIVVAVIFIVFFFIVDPTQIAVIGSVPMIIFAILTLTLSGTRMCVTTCDTSFMADIIDYELDRSGKYIPAVVTGTYSLIDKLISSVSTVIATGCVALLGYRETMPQPGDPCTTAIFLMSMALSYGLPIIGWIITLIAMRGCKLDKEEMANVQKRIADKKAAALAQMKQEAENS